jgi:hypothetical protein
MPAVEVSRIAHSYLSDPPLSPLLLLFIVGICVALLFSFEQSNVILPVP